MLTALLVGLAASSALVIGAVAGAFWRPPRCLVATALAFASGALITAPAFELFEEAFRVGGAWVAGIGLLVPPLSWRPTSYWIATAALRVSHYWLALPSTVYPRTSPWV